MNTQRAGFILTGVMRCVLASAALAAAACDGGAQSGPASPGRPGMVQISQASAAPPQAALPADFPTPGAGARLSVPSRTVFLHVAWDDTKADAAGTTMTLSAPGPYIPGEHTGVTDAQGRVAIEIPRAWDSFVIWNAEPRSIPWGGNHSPNERQPIEVKLTQMATVYGRVTIEGPDRPAAGARVEQAGTWHDGQVAIADEDGYYELRRLPPQDLTAPAKQVFLDATLGPYSATSQGPLLLQRGARHGPFDITLRRGGTRPPPYGVAAPPVPVPTTVPGDTSGAFAGVVTDEAGRPLRGVKVFWGLPSAPDGALGRAFTDANGAYRVDVRFYRSSRPDLPLCIVMAGWTPVAHAGAAPGPPDNPARVDFQLEPSHILHGVVAGPDGAPVADARVKAFLIASNGAAFDLGEDSRAATTDNFGWFRLTELPGPRVWIEVHPPAASGWGNLEMAVSVSEEARLTLPRAGN